MVHVCVCVHTHTYTHPHTISYICMYTCVYAHTYTHRHQFKSLNCCKKLALTLSGHVNECY